MINEERDSLRGYIKTALTVMVQAEMEDDDEGLLSSARNIEHLAQQLREHAEEHGL